MKLYWKLIITLVSFIPFFYKLGYLFDAWQYSPLDQKDYIFWMAALFLTACLLVWNYKKSSREPEGLDYYGFFMLGAAAALLAASFMKDINSAFLAGSLLFVAGGCWVVWGWRTLWMLFPVFFIAGLGLPSTTYWISFLFRDIVQGVSGFSIKLCFASVAAIWFALCLCFPKKIFIRPEPFFFCLAIFIFVIGYIQVSGPAPHGAPIRLSIKPGAANWLGENLPLSDLDESIQGKNISRRYLHFSRSNIDVGTLSVELRNDLHGVHPTALCLATARWEIVSNTQELLKTRYGILSAVKIVAERNGKRALFLAWYTNDSFSTGSFISFRKSWHYNETWYIYQITTPIITNETDAEKALLNFINTFAVRY